MTTTSNSRSLKTRFKSIRSEGGSHRERHATQRLPESQSCYITISYGKIFCHLPPRPGTAFNGGVQELNAENIRPVGGRVGFRSYFTLCYRTNLESRIASHILWEIATGRYRNEDDIYRGAYARPWNDWFEPSLTIRVDVSAIRCPLKSLNSSRLKSRTRYAIKSVGSRAAVPAWIPIGQISQPVPSDGP